MEGFRISIKGRAVKVPAIKFREVVIIVKGRLIKVAEIFDEFWLETDKLPDPFEVINHLRESPLKPDIFTFKQRVPDTEPKYQFHKDWDNVAAIKLDTYENWFNNQISSSVKRNIKACNKRGVTINISDYDAAFIKGIMSIYNESPVRQGRKFWHYGKSFAVVKNENSTYRERSIFFSAHYKDEMIGYLKLVLDKETAAIMQILSKMEHYNKRTNNGLIAAAVNECCNRKIKYLLYERYVYGNKTDNSLTEFKRKNAFIRYDIPKYFVPMNLKGKIALKAGMHIDPKDKLPKWLISIIVKARSKWYYRKLGA